MQTHTKIEITKKQNLYEKSNSQLSANSSAPRVWR